MRIHITQKDLREGVPFNCGECPIARATARAVKRVMGVTPHHVTVAGSVVAHVINGDGWVNHWWINEAINRFIRRYDGGDTTLKPTSYILDPGPMPATSEAVALTPPMLMAKAN